MKHIFVKIPVVALAALLTILASCKSPEQTTLKPAEGLLECCPDRGGLLDSLVNNNLAPTNEYAPYVTHGEIEDTLWITTSRPVPGKKPTNLPAEIFFALRGAEKRGLCPNEGWSAIQRYEPGGSDYDFFNSWTRGAVARNQDKIYFAAERPVDPASEYESAGTSFQLDIWVMTQDGTGAYGEAEAIDEINDPKYWDSQPHVSPCGKFMYFVSNRPVPGSTDTLNSNIWASVFEGGAWSRPIPVNSINTPGHEVSPHFGTDGTFYFASDWNYDADAKSSNGYDIYACRLEMKNGIPTPVDPVNINDIRKENACGGGFDLDVNTSADELFPSVAPDGSAIYYTSNREGGYGGYDVYGCKLPEPCIKLHVTVLQRTLDSASQKGTPAAEKFEFKKKSGVPLILRSSIHSDRSFNSDEKIDLSPNSDYWTEYKADANDCYACDDAKSRSYQTFARDSIIYDTIRVECVKLYDKIEFSDELGIPYFITGYWKPNTSDNLREFNSRRSSGCLDPSKFIDPADYDYSTVAGEIDQFFEDKIYSQIDPIVSKLEGCWDTLALKITVHGYTDGCRLMPGSYSCDDDITVGKYKIPQGWDMGLPYLNTTTGRENLPDGGQNGNIVLSMLRAYYTAETIDKDMSSRNSQYKRLKSKGLIDIDVKGYGIYDKSPCPGSYDVAASSYPNDPINPETCNKPHSRRIIIYFKVMPKSHLEHYDLVRCGEESDEYITYLESLEAPEPPVAEEEEEIAEDKELETAESKTSGSCTGTCYQIRICQTYGEDHANMMRSFLVRLGVDEDWLRDDIVVRDGKQWIVTEPKNSETVLEIMKVLETNIEPYKPLFADPTLDATIMNMDFKPLTKDQLDMIKE